MNPVDPEAWRRAFNAALDRAVEGLTPKGPSQVSSEAVVAELDTIVEEAEKRATSRLRGAAPT